MTASFRFTYLTLVTVSLFWLVEALKGFLAVALFRELLHVSHYEHKWARVSLGLDFTASTLTVLACCLLVASIIRIKASDWPEKVAVVFMVTSFIAAHAIEYLLSNSPPVEHENWNVPAHPVPGLISPGWSPNENQKPD